MNEKILDLSTLPDSAVIAIKEGFKMFTENTDRQRYFGYVDKRDLRDMCKRYEYTDVASFMKLNNVLLRR